MPARRGIVLHTSRGRAPGEGEAQLEDRSVDSTKTEGTVREIVMALAFMVWQSSDDDPHVKV
jgi:hypothetical protein